ncbi:hypothetical protein SAMN05444401_3559 [Clostridium amylolyticum]|uniref:Phage transcriptional activator, RinA family n=1 Tax=Clostridium amylolyticum TaxID=1121298 RepID=A0A1M6L0D0_9CLOT|nr:hypothetical protein [Clostridium amylolyticum]SHJ64592.1 hypothetical protein SAMN05444401_3559 [Clostridium amylolyticum]
MNRYTQEQQIAEWLREYNSYKAGIENLTETLNDLSEEGLGINYDKDPSGPTNKFNSRVENVVIKIDKLNIKHRIKIMTNIVNSVDRALASLTDIQRKIIISRCIEGKYYYQFCYQLCISERTARRIKKEALHQMSIVIFGKE